MSKIESKKLHTGYAVLSFRRKFLVWIELVSEFSVILIEIINFYFVGLETSASTRSPLFDVALPRLKEKLAWKMAIGSW
jgi:hypothetical protein